MLSGFELVNGHLVLRDGQLGLFANITPMNVGFNELSVELTGNSNSFKYSIISAFSYFDISDKASEIANGQYADLETYAHVHVQSTGSVQESITTVNLPGISDCRHSLTAIIPEGADLTLDEVVFGTDCPNT